MRFAHQRPLAPGTPLKVELGDSLILAEVAFTAREGDRFVSGVRVDQVLSRLSELMRLHKKLLAAAPASSKAGARVSVSNDAMLPLDARS